MSGGLPDVVKRRGLPEKGDMLAGEKRLAPRTLEEQPEILLRPQDVVSRPLVAILREDHHARDQDLLMALEFFRLGGDQKLEALAFGNVADALDGADDLSLRVAQR